MQDVIIIPDRSSYTDNDDIKQAVMTYGAVNACFYYEDASYNSTFQSYYYSGPPNGNHCVAIAGWDDNFDKTHFNKPAPDNGAFLIKNSWGTGWGANGYFYMSYDDVSVCEFVLFLGEPTTDYDEVYQYDPLGWITSLGLGTDTAWFANIFKAGAAQQITAVSLYAGAGNAPYALYFYQDVTTGPRTGSLAGTQTGTLATRRVPHPGAGLTRIRGVGTDILHRAESDHARLQLSGAH